MLILGPKVLFGATPTVELETFKESNKFPVDPLDFLKKTNCLHDTILKKVIGSKGLTSEQVELFYEAYSYSKGLDSKSYLSLYIDENLRDGNGFVTVEQLINQINSGNIALAKEDKEFFLYAHDFTKEMPNFNSLVGYFPSIKPDVIVSRMTCDITRKYPYFYGANWYLKRKEKKWFFLMPYRTGIKE